MGVTEVDGTKSSSQDSSSQDSRAVGSSPSAGVVWVPQGWTAQVPPPRNPVLVAPDRESLKEETTFR